MRKKSAALLLDLLLGAWLALGWLPWADVAFAAEVTIDATILDATDEYNPSPAGVFTSGLTGYAFYVDGSSDVVYTKTTNGGATWGTPVALPPDKIWQNVAVWYDQWTPGDTTGKKIHIAAVENGTDDVWYNSLATSNDALSGWVVIDTGTATLPPDGGPSIVKSTDGFLFAVWFDSVPRGRVLRSIDSGANWSSVTPASGMNDDDDHAQLLPLAGGDILLILWDESATDLLSNVWDEATDSWSGFSIIDAAIVTDLVYDAVFGASIAKSTGDIYLSYDNDVDAATGDLKAKKFTESSRTWSDLTDIATNLAAAIDVKIAVDQNTGNLYATYIRGGTAAATTHVYSKSSTNGGSSWSAETQISTTLDDLRTVRTNLTSMKKLFVFWYNDDLDDILGSTLANVATTSITGKAFSDEGTTPLAAGKDISVSLNGAAREASGTTIAGGQYTISAVPLDPGTVITLYLDNETSDGVTVTIGTGGSMTGMTIYQDHLIVRSDSGSTALSNSNLDTADGSGDADISAIYIMTGTNTLFVKNDKELYVWTADTFAPGSRVRTGALEVRGTMTMGTNGLTVVGSLAANVGTLTSSTGTTLASSANSSTINLGTNSLLDLSLNNGLVGYWKFDDGIGVTQDQITHDSSGNRFHGFFARMNDGAQKWFVADAPTKFYNPYTLKFDTTNDAVYVGGTGSLLQITGDLTVAWWQNVGSTTNSIGTVISYGGNGDTLATNYAYQVGPTSAGKVTAFHEHAAGTNTQVTSTTSFTLNTWQHWAVVRNTTAKTYRFFLNGTPEAAQTYVNNPAGGTAGFVTIGDSAGFNERTNGKIDDLRVYSRTLSVSEVAALGSGNRSTGSGIYLLQSNVQLTGKLGIYTGELDVAGSNYAITLSGSWANESVFTARAGTVKLNGVQQTLSGSTVFSTLQKTVTAADTLSFDPTSRQSISGSLILRGSAGNLLSLRSLRSGSAALLLLDGDSGAQTLDYLNVKDSKASNGAQLVCSTSSEGCVDSGNNTNWLFTSASGPRRHFFFFFGF